jgi:hypothetical protein
MISRPFAACKLLHPPATLQHRLAQSLRDLVIRRDTFAAIAHVKNNEEQAPSRPPLAVY